MGKVRFLFKQSDKLTILSVLQFLVSFEEKIITDVLN